MEKRRHFLKSLLITSFLLSLIPCDALAQGKNLPTSLAIGALCGTVAYLQIKLMCTYVIERELKNGYQLTEQDVEDMKDLDHFYLPTLSFIAGASAFLISAAVLTVMNNQSMAVITNR